MGAQHDWFYPRSKAHELLSLATKINLEAKQGF